MRWIHIAAGSAGIASGAVALAALKGGRLHRWAGRVFVYSMLVMSSIAAVLAALKQPHPGNIIGGALTFYLVVTGLLSVWRPPRVARRTDRIVMLAAWAISLVSIAMGVFLEIDPRTPGGVPPRMFYFIIGAAAAWLAVKDMRMIAAGGPRGTARLKRHLGRLGPAAFIATGSLFLGQPKVFAGGPLEPVVFRAIPVAAVLAAILYWTVQLRRPGRADRSAASGAGSRGASPAPLH
jgi:uncharacterized membrane protein